MRKSRIQVLISRNLLRSRVHWRDECIAFFFQMPWETTNISIGPIKRNAIILLFRNSSSREVTSRELSAGCNQSATISPSPCLCRLQSFFTVRMIEDSGGIFGLVSPWPRIVGRLLHSPNIVRDLGYGWWHHGRKLRKACARMLLMYWKISPALFPRLLSVFWQGGIRNHEVPGYAHQSYPLFPHSRFPSVSGGILLHLT